MGEVCFDRCGVLLVGGFGGDGRLEDVDEDYFVVGVEEDFGEELAYEAAGACDEDLHCDCVIGGAVGFVILGRDCRLEMQSKNGNGSTKA